MYSTSKHTLIALFIAWGAAACYSNPQPEKPVTTTAQSEQLALASTCPPATRSDPQLESGLQARKTIQQAYPDSLQAQGVGGKIGLWLLVLDDGTVGDVTIAEGSGHAGLDAAAMSAGWYLEYHPACREGRAADVWLYQEFVFKPES